jgi:hypothetical protein
LVKIGNGADQGCEAGRGTSQASGGGEVVLGDDPERVGGELGERRVGILESFAESTKVGNAGECALGGLNVLGLSIQVQGVRSWVISRA